MKGKTLEQIAAALSLACSSKKTVLDFAIDSRKIQPGSLFFAMKGVKVDGHQFLRDVAGRGAVGAVVDQHYAGDDFGLVLLRVPHVLDALHHLAKLVFQKRKERIVAVTGSVGKTTTKEFIADLLSVRYRVEKTHGNANSQVSLPLTLLNLEGEYDILVLEMGMSLPGEIAKLVEIAPPDVALVTAIAPAHIGFFPNGLEGVAAAKAEIFNSPRTKIGFLSAQAAEFPAILHTRCPKIIYSLSDLPFMQVPFTASHLLENLTGAIAVACAFDLNWEEIQRGCMRLKPFAMRFETIEREGVIFINDCYNANPASMRAALTNLPKPSQGRRTVGVLGTMAHQGHLSHAHHAEIGELALKCVDELLCIGAECAPMVEIFKQAGRPVELFSDLEEMKRRLGGLVQAGDVVLIKGENSQKLWQIMDDISCSSSC